MKKLDEYINLYNKNLDLKSTESQNQPTNPTNENYEPKIGIATKNIVPMLVRLGLITATALILVSLATYLFVLKNIESYEAIIVSILEKMSIFDAKGSLEYRNITDINYVELTDDELAVIGILKKGDTISIITEDLMTQTINNVNFNKILDSIKKLPNNKNADIKVDIASNKRFSKLGYDTTRTQLIKTKYNISFYSFNSYDMRYQGWEHDKISSFSPVSIQSFCKSKVRYSVSYMAYLYPSNMSNEYKSGLDSLSKHIESSNSKKSINAMGSLAKLIPVKIKLYNKSGYKPEKEKYTIVETEIILWYVPTDEFINALPERYSSRLRNELEIIEKIEKGEIKKEEACKELQESVSILGLCPVHHENLEIKSIYPSPGRDDTHIKFTNGKEQKLSVYLFDMTGKEVKCIADKKLFLQGEHNLWIDLSNLISGIYIAVIIDDEGNAISSKFIKE